MRKMLLLHQGKEKLPVSILAKNFSDNSFSFMSSAKGTPACWKQFLYDVLAMLKQLGIPTSFFWHSHVLTLDGKNFHILLRN